MSVTFRQRLVHSPLSHAALDLHRGPYFWDVPCPACRMLPSRVWRSLVSTFWRYSLSSPDSGVAATASSKTVMTQLDNILDEVQGSSGPEASSTHPAEDHEQALYGALGCSCVGVLSRVCWCL